MIDGSDEDAPRDVDVLPARLPPEELSAPPSPMGASPRVSDLSDEVPGSAIGRRDLARMPRDSSDSGELRPFAPDDLDLALLTESQRRRLAPIKSLKRTRRSRKVRVGESAGAKYVPLVKGARASTDESILAAFSADDLSAKREQGEDYYVDPQLLKDELQREAEVAARRSKFKLKEKAYAADKLKQELVRAEPLEHGEGRTSHAAPPHAETPHAATPPMIPPLATSPQALPRPLLLLGGAVQEQSHRLDCHQRRPARCAVCCLPWIARREPIALDSLFPRIALKHCRTSRTQ